MVFGFARQRRKRRYREIAAQVSAIQRCLFSQLHPRLTKEHGAIFGAQLAQSVVDRLFGRRVSLQGDALQLVDQLSSSLAERNQTVRDAAFVSLRAMLEVEGASNDFVAERRIVDTLHWLKQFGEMPANIPLTEVLDRLAADVDLEGPPESQ